MINKHHQPTSSCLPVKSGMCFPVSTILWIQLPPPFPNFPLPWQLMELLTFLKLLHYVHRNQHESSQRTEDDSITGCLDFFQIPKVEKKTWALKRREISWLWMWTGKLWRRWYEWTTCEVWYKNWISTTKKNKMQLYLQGGDSDNWLVLQEENWCFFSFITANDRCFFVWFFRSQMPGPKIQIIRERHGTSQISSSNEAQAHPNLSARICAKRPHDHCMKGHGWFLTTWTNHFKNLWSLLFVLPIFEKTPSSMSPKYFSEFKKCCCLEYIKHH